ncbi:MAG TPA: hypothetical protein VMN36_19195 [Verrucomicrobiales bacterium]|nr:hypothetical protein [Verrucomicrobiales bacterium]
MKSFAPVSLGLTAVLALFSIPAAAIADPSDVSLMIEGEDFQPSSTLEVRFTRDMVPAKAKFLSVKPPSTRGDRRRGRRRGRESKFLAVSL